MWIQKKRRMPQLPAFRPGNSAGEYARPPTNLPKTRQGRRIFVNPAFVWACNYWFYLLKSTHYSQTLCGTHFA
jgi:hypothetical protein